jgi:hypothetical protein
MNPWSICELLDSPGCIRPVMSIFFFSFVVSESVICKTGMLMPASDFPKTEMVV